MKKETRNKILLAIFFILFFGIAYQCAAQSPMRFMIPSKIKDSISQTILIGICQEKGEYRVYAKFPSKQHFNLRIGFENGDIEYLQYLTDGEFNISQRALKRLKTTEITTIYLDSKESLICRNIKTKDYFINQLKQK